MEGCLISKFFGGGQAGKRILNKFDSRAADIFTAALFVCGTALRRKLAHFCARYDNLAGVYFFEVCAM